VAYSNRANPVPPALAAALASLALALWLFW